jgi:hypothetical protein
MAVAMSVIRNETYLAAFELGDLGDLGINGLNGFPEEAGWLRLVQGKT